MLFVGTLEPRKDVAHAAGRRTGCVPDAPPLVLVGPPGWGEQVDVDRCVVTPGFVDDDDLRPVVAGASALVLPRATRASG